MTEATRTNDRADSDESRYLGITRSSYDKVAGAYAELVADALDSRPLDRALFGAFVEMVETAVRVGAEIADIGCGPGHVTAHLCGRGANAFGLDLSPEMVAVARRRHPDIRFTEGSMTALDLADGSLGGVVSWYSIVHTPPTSLPTVFAEFHRVLAPGGQLMLGFKAGERLRHLDHAYGHDLSLDVYWMPPDRIAALLEAAGFTVDSRVIREPGEAERAAGQGRQAVLLAHRSTEPQEG
ncbi:class I SAM-dependent methyltransferase [Streptacidiphilus rugosus]|uniref:class I SAM-dependent methyltransferase n=1 Tax=Streptacidiphilus rugosus TaxID=405783 RepID=UPI00068F6ECD|nr:class I SAM-dependent methyltransferase [Streptacidiphilus rugosus]